MSYTYQTWRNPAARALLGQSLQDNKVSITSSDTVLGFLAPLTLMGFNKLDNLKKRANKPYLILMGNKGDLGYFTDQSLSPGLQRMINSCWPGPVTMIFKAKDSLPSYVKGPDGTIAVRVPDHAGLLEVLKDFPGLFSTSANLHGQPIPERIEDIDLQVLEAIEYVVSDEDSGLEKDKRPSTILDCTGEQIRVVRTGAFDIQVLEGFAGQVFKKD